MQEVEAIAHRWFEEVWNQGNQQTIDELLHPESKAWHEPRAFVVGPGGTRSFFAKEFGAFEPPRFRLIEVFPKGDKAAIWWEAHMKHTKAGWRDVAATNKTVIVRGMTIIRIEAGRIVEGWDFWDRSDVTTQLVA